MEEAEVKNKKEKTSGEMVFVVWAHILLLIFLLI